jgi:hypothetical protein
MSAPTVSADPEAESSAATLPSTISSARMVAPRAASAPLYGQPSAAVSCDGERQVADWFEAIRGYSNGQR